MRKIFIVMRHEFVALIIKPSFWIALIGVPIFMGVIMVVTLVSSTAATASALAARQSRAEMQGYVDYSGIVKQLPAGTRLKAYRDEAEARAALEAGAISGYFVVQPDYLQTGQVSYLSREFNPLDSPVEALEHVLNYNLLGGNASLLEAFESPVVLTSETATAPAEVKGGSGAPFPILPMAASIIFSVLLMTASGYLMQSVSTEKENRVIEVLMSSLSPTQLLAGKVLGLGLISLVQMALWLVSGLAALRFIPASALLGTVDAATVVAALVFFVLGYFIYAGLLAGLGALMPGMREASQYTFLIILPLLIPLYLNTTISLEPDGPVAVALSLIPFTAPVALIMRMTVTDVPAWQVLMATGLLVAAAVGVIWLAARLFRAQSLLRGTKPSLREIALALK
ncbi:MAG: ABC transporter permease [Anaerolineae bacterium]|nr:ABC transporter permease [Thermoflexales bacterium]MDW8407899.1 ABC transporter permease [Anaerolineae bacterium]